MTQAQQPLRIQNLEECRVMNLETIERLNALNDWQAKRIATLEVELAALKAAPAAQEVEPYAVLVREIGESSFFDSKPIKPGSVQHQHAKSSPHYDYVELYAHPAPQAQDVQRDAAFEAVRKKFCKLPRYSFFLSDPAGVKRVQDTCGNWVDFEAVHTLFDPVAIDAAIAASAKGGE